MLKKMYCQYIGVGRIPSFSDEFVVVQTVGGNLELWPLYEVKVLNHEGEDKILKAIEDLLK